MVAGLPPEIPQPVTATVIAARKAALNSETAILIVIRDKFIIGFPVCKGFGLDSATEAIAPRGWKGRKTQKTSRHEGREALYPPCSQKGNGTINYQSLP